MQAKLAESDHLTNLTLQVKLLQPSAEAEFLPCQPATYSWFERFAEFQKPPTLHWKRINRTSHRAPATIGTEGEQVP